MKDGELGMSFRWKTILGIAAIELFFLSLLVWQAARYMQDMGETNIQRRAVDTVSLASTVLLDSLISYDLAAIEEQVHQLGELDGVTYVTLEGHGKDLASTGQYPVSESRPDTAVDSVTDGIYDVAHELIVLGQPLGLLKIGFSVQELHAVTAQAKARLYLIAFFELILVGLCSWLLARYLTNRILLLRKASEKLHSGHRVDPIPTVGKDEISTTINAFNRMSSTLLEREQSLKLTNEKLKDANSKLSERENEIWSLFNAAPDGIAVLDSGGTISFANRQLEKLLELGKTSVVGRPLKDFARSVEGEKFPESLTGKAVAPRRQHCKLLNFSGKTLFVEINTSVFRSTDSYRTIVIIRDKTHEQELEHAVRLQEQLKSNLVDSSLDALVTINGDGHVIDFSQSAESLFGWRKADILGQPMENYLIPSELRDAHQKGMAHFLATGEGPLIGKRVETNACRKDGKSFPVELALTAIWVDGEVFVTAAIRDITERKQREDELVNAKAEAEDASQAKSRFLSYMSHEIRSPMNAVLGSLALIQERGNLQESEQYYLDLARESGDSLLQVVNEVLDFSKIEAGHVQFRQGSCSLAELIRSVQSAILAKGVKKDVTLHTELEESIPSVIMTDGEHLRQILTILLDNAYKFTEKGEITCAVNDVTAVVEAGPRRLRISVQDTGPGVPSELVDTIFSEFEQTDAIRDSGFGGTGLGLAIAKRLVTAMGGAIWLESAVGVGSTFTVELPFDTCGADTAIPIQTDPSEEDTRKGNLSVQTSGLKILLVDDVEANLIIGAELLKNRGHSVDVAHDGEEAVHRACETEYSVILMDMRMPKLNGLEATQQIRSSTGKNSSTPIIALTANAEKSEIKRCLEGGMNDFVSKPFDIERLNSTIEKCLSDKRQEDLKMHEPVESKDEDQEVLSDDVLNQLTKDTSAESLPMMISVFINEIKKRIEGIDRAEALGDESEIREQAHALKSCAGTFGGMRLQAAAHELENLASRSRACSDDVIPMVRKVAEQTLEAYSGYRERLQASSETKD